MRFYPHRTPFFLKLAYPNFIWNMPQNDHRIFLTFDDGPIPGLTDFVLDTLDSYNAKATFFCVGENIRKYPEIFLKILEKGHAIGNHTHHHLNGWDSDIEKYLEDVRQCQEQMNELLPQEPSRLLFRPPYGKVTRKAAKMLLKEYEIIMWTNLTGDFDSSLAKEDCLKKALNNSSSGDIVVFHDNFKAEETLRYVLPRYLQELSDKGYNFARF